MSKSYYHGRPSKRDGDQPEGLLPDSAGLTGREWMMLPMDDVVLVAGLYGKLRRGEITREEWHASIEAVRARLMVEKGV